MQLKTNKTNSSTTTRLESIFNGSSLLMRFAFISRNLNVFVIEQPVVYTLRTERITLYLM